MPTEKLCAELDAGIAKLQAERDTARRLLERLINDIETGASAASCVNECKRVLGF
jgi:hypothetical protein